MKSVTLDMPMFGFVVATRAALGAGIGLLVAERLSPARRQIVGRILVATGLLTTVPAVSAILRSIRGRRNDRALAGVQRDDRLIGAQRAPRKGDDLV